MTWTAPVQVNDDKSGNSHFLPSIAVDQTDGDVAVSWYDARNDPGDFKTEFFAAVSSDGGKTFSHNTAVSLGQSNANDPGLPGFAQVLQYGDHTGLAFYAGRLYPAWTDNSVELVQNPGLPLFDIAVGRVATAA